MLRLKRAEPKPESKAGVFGVPQSRMGGDDDDGEVVVRGGGEVVIPRGRGGGYSSRQD